MGLCYISIINNAQHPPPVPMLALFSSLVFRVSLPQFLFHFTEWHDALERLSLFFQQEAQSMLLDSDLLQHGRRDPSGRLGVAEDWLGLAGNLTWWWYWWFLYCTFTINFESFVARSFWRWQVWWRDGEQFRLNGQMGQGTRGQQAGQSHLLIIDQFGHSRLVCVQYWIGYWAILFEWWFVLLST